MYSMLKRHTELRDAVSELGHEDLDDYFLRASAERKVDALYGKLNELNEIVLKLQPADCALRISRAYFDFLSKSYPALVGRLTSYPKTVKNPSFEVGIVKVQDDRDDDLTTSKNQAL